MVLAQEQIQSQWNRIEDMSPHNHSCLILDKGAKKHMMEKRQPFQQMFLGKLDLCLQKTKTRSMFVTLFKYQLKVD
jgi:hypothetical protein